MAVRTVYASAQGVTDCEGYTLSVLSIDRYLPPALDLFPPGPLWSREPTGDLANLVRAIVAEASRVEYRGQALLRETDPRQSEELLGDFERVLGHAVDGDREIRQRTAAERWAAVGGASPDFFLDVAAQLGYTIAIERGSEDSAELDEWELDVDDLAENANAYWVVHVRYGPDDSELEAAIRRYAPLGTTVVFVYDL
jgi:uncharacterized protein YmfQ (DUF2313 family)